MKWLFQLFNWEPLVFYLYAFLEQRSTGEFLRLVEFLTASQLLLTHLTPNNYCHWFLKYWKMVNWVHGFSPSQLMLWLFAFLLPGETIEVYWAWALETFAQLHLSLFNYWYKICWINNLLVIQFPLLLFFWNSPSTSFHYFWFNIKW